MLPFQTWGRANNNGRVIGLYGEGGCDVAVCRYLATKYGVIPFGPEDSKWGSLPEKYKPGWWQYRPPLLAGVRGGTCDQVVGEQSARWPTSGCLAHAWQAGARSVCWELGIGKAMSRSSTLNDLEPFPWTCVRIHACAARAVGKYTLGAPDTDFEGNNLGGARSFPTVTACLRYCTRTAGCVMAVYGSLAGCQNCCWLKSKVGSSTAKAGVRPYQPYDMVAANTYYSGSDIGDLQASNVTLAECRARCLKRVDCKMFMYGRALGDAATGWCLPKNAVPSQTSRFDGLNAYFPGAWAQVYLRYKS